MLNSFSFLFSPKVPPAHLLMMIFSGLRLVQWSLGGAQWTLLVPFRCGYGPGPVWATTGHMGLLPSLPGPQRLPQNWWWDLLINFLLKIRKSFSDNLKNGRFHQQIRDTFAPQVIRYVDLMESSIAQSIHKGFEKERWEMKG